MGLTLGYKVVDANLASRHSRPWPSVQYELVATMEVGYPGISAVPTIEGCLPWLRNPDDRIIELEYDPTDRWTLGHKRDGKPDDRPAGIRRFRVVREVALP